MLAGLAVIAVLWWAQPVLIPLVFSLLISYALEPIVARLESWRMPRVLAVPVVLTVVIATMSLGIYGLRGEAVAFINRLPDAVHTIARTIRASRQTTTGLAATVRQATLELDSATDGGPRPPADRRVTPVRIEEPMFKWSDWIWQGSRGAIELGFQLFAVFCLVYYILVAGDMYKRKVVRVAGPSLMRRKLTVQILADIDRQIQSFLWARTVVNIAVGAAVWLAFSLLRIEDAGVWGVLATALFMIPFAGPAVFIVCAGLAGFVQFGSLAMAGTVTAICLAIAMIEGNFLAPWLMSRAGRMNALAVFVSLMFWGWIWGIWGLFLAVPIMASAKAICERLDGLQPVAELLGE